MSEALKRAVAEKIMGLKDFESINGKWRHTYDGEHGGRFSLVVPAYSTHHLSTHLVIDKAKETHGVSVTFRGKMCSVIVQPLTAGPFENIVRWAEESFGRSVCIAVLKAFGHSTEGL